MVEVLLTSRYSDQIINQPNRYDVSPLELALDEFLSPSKATQRDSLRDHLSNFAEIIKNLLEKGAKADIVCKVLLKLTLELYPDAHYLFII